MGASGAALFAANCVGCHGANGGGVGPRLVGNPRVADATIVESTIRDGRGMIPSFGNLLSETELETLTRYVTGFADRE